MSNITIFISGKPCETSSIKRQECMGLMFSQKNPITIILPPKLNRGITIDVVKEWIAIGNKLGFNGEFVEDIKLMPVNISQIISPKLAGIEVDCSKAKYIPNEYRNSERKTISSVSISGTTYNPRDLFVCLAIKGWARYTFMAKDIFTMDGICATDLILQEIEKVKKDGMISYSGIILENSGMLQYEMMLKTIFYRFLYSNYYSGIVLATIDLVKKGVDEWTALSYACAKSKTRAYYSFAGTGRLFADKEVVFDKLKKREASSINSIFNGQDLSRVSVDQYLGIQLKSDIGKK